MLHNRFLETRLENMSSRSDLAKAFLAVVVPLFGACLITTFHHLGPTLRDPLINIWKVISLLTLVVFVIAVLYRLLVGNSSSATSSGGKLYVGERASETVVNPRANLKPESINRLFRFLAFICLLFAIYACIQTFRSEEALWTKTATERLTILVAFILFGLNYRQRVLSNPNRWTEQLTLYGIGPRRTFKLSPAVKVRFLSLTRLERVDKHGPKQPVTYHALDLVDGDKVFPVNYSAHEESAMALAQSLQLDSFERMVIDQVGDQEPPEGLVQLHRLPQETLVRPWFLPIALAFLTIVSLPYLYESSIKQENARTFFIEDYQELIRVVKLEEDGQLEEALAIYTQMLAESPQSHSALLGQARVLLSLGRFEQAVAKLEEYRVLDPRRWLGQSSIDSSAAPWPKQKSLAVAYRSVGRPHTALWVLRHELAPDLRIALHADLEQWAEAEEIISRLHESEVEELAPLIQRVKERRPDPEVQVTQEELPAEP